MKKNRFISAITAIATSVTAVSLLPFIPSETYAADVVYNDFEQSYGGWYGNTVAAAILLLIEAIVMYSITASHTESPRSQWIMSLVFRVAAVLLIIGAVICMIVDSFSGTAITAGILLLVEGIVFWAMGSGNNPFHSASSPIRAVPGMNKTVQELCDALGNTETQLGFPWLGRIRAIKDDTIIYGPSEEGVFIYGYYHFGRFYVAFSRDISLLEATEADAHRITEIPDSNGICLGKETLPDAYAYMITRYSIHSGSANLLLLLFSQLNCNTGLCCSATFFC